MKLPEKLIQLRREKGYSQEQLADLLGVSRQSVSKWEAGQSTPELAKLLTLADLFGVTLDALIREEQPVHPPAAPEPPAPAAGPCTFPCFYFRYEYKSKRTLFGLPLVHINLGRGIHVARGIIAVGDIAIGLLSAGVLSLGIISVGALALGLLALGAFAFGALAVGAVAVGIVAAGALAVGVYALGACAIASQIAMGAAASGDTAVGVSAAGTHTLLLTENTTAEEVRTFLNLHHPRLWKPIWTLFTWFWQL